MRPLDGPILAVLLVVAGTAFAEDGAPPRPDRVAELCEIRPGPQRSRLVADQCTALGAMDERRACREGMARFMEALNTICAARRGTPAGGSCEAACSGSGFDFAAWSCRAVTDRRGMHARCIEKGRELVRARVGSCMSACRDALDARGARGAD